jgi:hypothetical protein
MTEVHDLPTPALVVDAQAHDVLAEHCLAHQPAGIADRQGGER